MKVNWVGFEIYFSNQIFLQLHLFLLVVTQVKHQARRIQTHLTCDCFLAFRRLPYFDRSRLMFQTIMNLSKTSIVHCSPMIPNNLKILQAQAHFLQVFANVCYLSILFNAIPHSYSMKYHFLVKTKYLPSLAPAKY